MGRPMMLLALTLFVAVLPSRAPASQPADGTCRPPALTRQATPAEIVAELRGRKRSVLTFLGYSDAEYEDRQSMLETAGSVLGTLDPGTTIVTIGGTPTGIGAVYELAKRRRFVTAGIVSTLARGGKVPLSPCVDLLFYVADSQWGGFVEGTGLVSPTSRAMVDVSHRVVAIGGGEVSRVEYLTAERAGKPVAFFPADMNHANARKRAASRGLAAPTDFRGALGAALVGRRRQILNGSDRRPLRGPAHSVR